MLNGLMSSSGSLKYKTIRCAKAPLSWRIKNFVRVGFIKGWLGVRVFKAAAKVTGGTAITSELSARVKKDGSWIDYGVLSNRVVTDTGVAFLVDAWDNRATNLEDMNYHGCGTGAGAEAAANTALVTECTTTLNPDSTRATGARSQPTAPQYRTAGTMTFDGAAAVIEHGIFSQAATGGGVLWDRSVFAAINVASGDSIVFTYTLTLTSGG